METVEKGRTKGIIHGRGCAVENNVCFWLHGSEAEFLHTPHSGVLSASVWVVLFGCELKTNKQVEG